MNAKYIIVYGERRDTQGSNVIPVSMIRHDSTRVGREEGWTRQCSHRLGEGGEGGGVSY